MTIGPGRKLRLADGLAGALRLRVRGNFRGAMRTAGRLERDRREAVRALTPGSEDGFLAAKTVDLTNQHEDRQGDDEEVRGGAEKDAIVDGGGTGGLGFGERGVGVSGKIDELVREVGVTAKQTDGRHEDVGDEGADDASEGGADDDADSHVEHAAAQGEFAEVIEKASALIAEQGLRTAEVSDSEVVEDGVAGWLHGAPPMPSMVGVGGRHVKSRRWGWVIPPTICLAVILCRMFRMSKIAEIALIAAIACIGSANLIGATMSRLATQKTGQSYWPPAANVKMAQDYRVHFGADRNYVYYGVLHFAFLGLILFAAFLFALFH